MIQLRPLDDAGFRAFLERAVPRRAERFISRGLWSEAAAVEESRRGYAEAFPQGLATPGEFVCDLFEPNLGRTVGEVWYSARPTGGRLRFMVEWITVEPPYRRRGYAAETLQLLEAEAARLGATWIELNVWADNPGAQALYLRMGYTPRMTLMAKPLTPPLPPEAARPT